MPRPLSGPRYLDFTEEPELEEISRPVCPECFTEVSVTGDCMCVA